MNQRQQRVHLTGHHEAIKERWFAAGNEFLRPFRIKLDNLFPMAVRMEQFARYDAAADKAFKEKMRLAQALLYEQRNLVNNKWLPRYDIRIGESGGPAHEEMVGLLVDGCLDRLCETLGAYAPMLLSVDDAAEVTPTLLSIYDIESKRLKEFLNRYHVTLRSGLVPVAQDLEA